MAPTRSCLPLPSRNGPLPRFEPVPIKGKPISQTRG
jgi:hypothetical protein